MLLIWRSIDNLTALIQQSNFLSDGDIALFCKLHLITSLTLQLNQSPFLSRPKPCTKAPTARYHGFVDRSYKSLSLEGEWNYFIKSITNMRNVFWNGRCIMKCNRYMPQRNCQNFRVNFDTFLTNLCTILIHFVATSAIWFYKTRGDPWPFKKASISALVGKCWIHRAPFAVHLVHLVHIGAIGCCSLGAHWCNVHLVHIGAIFTWCTLVLCSLGAGRKCRLVESPPSFPSQV